MNHPNWMVAVVHTIAPDDVGEYFCCLEGVAGLGFSLSHRWTGSTEQVTREHVGSQIQYVDNIELGSWLHLEPLTLCGKR